MTHLPRSLAVLLLAGAVFTSLIAHNAQAGPYAPAAGRIGTTAIAHTDPGIRGWVTGHQKYRPGAAVDTGFRTPSKAYGPAIGDNFDVVSLGDGGSITLSFTGTLYNGRGWDFAVFENSFSNSFLELAFVEVSSDGKNFFRFPSFSLTPSPVGAFGAVDPTNLHGLAGKYRRGFGTPFDLKVLRGVRGLNVNRVTHIRLVDVVGDGRERDALGKRIYDPYPTTGSVGFDLDGIAVHHLRPPQALARAAAVKSFAATSVGPTLVPLPPAAGLLALATGVLALRGRRRARTAAV